jgi:hypothetical protein
VKNIVRA